MTPEEQTKRLSDRLNDAREEMVGLTQDLCAFATENPPGRHFEECVDFLDDYSRSIGLETIKIRTPDAYQKQYAPAETWDFPRYNLVARWDVGASRVIHFNSHYDVVPATSDWKTDPFNPVVQNKRLYGRGVQDMKGCLAASLFAVKAMRECGLTPPWNIELSFTADEEIGGHCGAGYITREGLVKPDAAVICEGGMGRVISHGQRGVYWSKVTTRGVSGHGSSPNSGVNAFEKGLALARRFQALHKTHRKRVTAYKMVAPEFRRPTLTLGGVSGGGSKVNTIPDRFYFTLDRRIIAEETTAEIEREYRLLIDDAMKLDRFLLAEIETLSAFDAGFTDPNHPLCRSAVEAVRRVYGKPGQLKMFGAFTDLHFFANVVKCPAIGYGVEGEGLHSSNEYLLIDSLPRTAQVYAEIALSMDSDQSK